MKTTEEETPDYVSRATAELHTALEERDQTIRNLTARLKEQEEMASAAFLKAQEAWRRREAILERSETRLLAQIDILQDTLQGLYSGWNPRPSPKPEQESVSYEPTQFPEEPLKE